MTVSENKLKVKCFYESFDLDRASAKRSFYLNAVDNYIYSNCKSPFILDIGSGNGRRIYKIAKQLNANVTTVDITNKSFIACHELGFNAYQADIENFYINKSFDVITCLWSVLSYVNPVYSLKNIKAMLAENGVLFFDVNVRYNFAEYGIYNCLKNMTIDLFKSPSRFSIGDKCDVYLFDYWELDSILLNLGFKFKKVYLNYSNGRKTNIFFGQLLYICTHDLRE